MTNRSDWELVRIKDIGTVKTGRTPPTVVASNFGDEYLFITPSDMDGRKKIYDTERKVSSLGASVLASCQLPANSICVSCIGWQMGKVVMTTQTCFTNQQINTIIPNDKILPDFLYYSLSTRREEFKTLGSVGTRTPILKKSLFENLGIYLPPLPIQRKIAAILSTYDRLIENNTRRIEILEEMARSLYREWFVKFRFPGHEQVQMVDSELGPIPKGWEVKQLSEVCEIIMGLSPKSEFYNENAEGLPLHQGVTNFGAWFPTDKVYTTTITRLAQIGDILFSVRAPVGRINIANKTIVIGRGICAIRSKTGKQNFVLQQLKDKFYEDNLMGGGTIYPSVTKEEVQKIKMLVPLPEKILAFESQSLPVFRQIEVFLLKNDNLRKTRDLLLPRLISGEIDVENLDIKTSQNAA